jgi:hypothetical protein
MVATTNVATMTEALHAIITQTSGTILHLPSTVMIAAALIRAMATSTMTEVMSGKTDTMTEPPIRTTSIEIAAVTSKIAAAVMLETEHHQRHFIVKTHGVIRTTLLLIRPILQPLLPRRSLLLPRTPKLPLPQHRLLPPTATLQAARQQSHCRQYKRHHL